MDACPSPIHSYKYTALNPASSGIRFVTIEPGCWDAPIKCSLHHDFLDSKPTYEALSYTWGDPKDTRPIELNGARFDVTINLESALRHLRLENRPRILWVDAICIDQGNLQERSAEVKRMRDIYTLAETVIAWAGDADEDSEKAMTLMQEISDFANAAIEIPAQQFEFSPAYMRRLGLDVSSKPWSSLWTFWQRPYWSRMWVVQELACSGNFFEASEDRCVLRCGHREVKLHQFADVCVFIYAAGTSSNFVPYGARVEEPALTMYLRGSSAATQMYVALMLCVANLQCFPVTDLMSVTKQFKASDCRDKLYAILGITREADMDIIPDYSKPPAEIYMDFVRLLVTHDHDLQSLGGNRFGTNAFGPSWIPELYGAPGSGPAWANETRHYKASGAVESDVAFKTERSLLYTRGTLLGTLNTVIGPFSAKADSPVNSQTSDVLELHKERGVDVLFKAMAEFHNNLDTSQREVFWRTVVMDADFSDVSNPVIPAPDEFGTMHKILSGLAPVPDTFEPDRPETDRILRFCRPWDANMANCLERRSFFTTACGRMGIGPHGSKPGDVVTVLYGGDFCFVLRPKNDQYELIGDAYLHGVMRGELFGGPDGDQLPVSQLFTLC